jgi:hypothetical protein
MSARKRCRPMSCGCKNCEKEERIRKLIQEMKGKR